MHGTDVMRVSAHLYSPPQLLYELLVNVLHPLRVLLVQRTEHAAESVETVSKSRPKQKYKCVVYLLRWYDWLGLRD